MARTKQTSHVPIKPILYGAGCLVAGILLVIASRAVKPEDPHGDHEPPATAPATSTATAPDSQADSEEGGPPAKRESPPSAIASLGGLLLLFGAAGFGMCLFCIGWFVVEIRKARPAWKKRTKYPKMR